MFLESFSSVALGEEIINESGVCQNCFIKFNEYDEHLSMAEQIQNELIGLMDNKIYALEEVPEAGIKTESQDEIEEFEEFSNADPIEYEPYGAEEMYITGEDENENEEILTEDIPEDFHFEVIVDELKERKNQTRNIRPKVKPEHESFVIIEMDGHQKGFQCDICLKIFKDRSKLRTHKEIHTDERNVICPVSDFIKAFENLFYCIIF